MGHARPLCSRVHTSTRLMNNRFRYSIIHRSTLHCRARSLAVARYISGIERIQGERNRRNVFAISSFDERSQSLLSSLRRFFPASVPRFAGFQSDSLSQFSNFCEYLRYPSHAEDNWRQISRFRAALIFFYCIYNPELSFPAPAGSPLPAAADITFGNKIYENACPNTARRWERSRRHLEGHRSLL